MANNKTAKIPSVNTTVLNTKPGPIYAKADRDIDKSKITKKINIINLLFITF